MNCTSDWKGATVVKPDAAASAGRIDNILMVQNQYDAATPLDGALATYNLLGNASLIYSSGSYTHGVFPSGTSCVDEAVVDYLLSPTSIEHTVTVCQGESLIPFITARDVDELSPARPNEALTRGILNAVTPASGVDYIDEVFKNPEAALQLIQDIHDQIR